MPDRRSVVRIAAGLAGAAGATALSLGSAGTLTLPAWAIFASALGAGCGTAATPIVDSMRDRRRAKRLEYDKKIRWHLSALVRLNANTQNWSQIGASLYLIQQKGRPWKRHRRLERTSYQHIQDKPAPPPPVWEKGKGVVGKCWEKMSEVDGVQAAEVVYAAPITEPGSRIVGVVTLATEQSLVATLEKERVQGFVRFTATNLAESLKESGVRGVNG